MAWNVDRARRRITKHIESAPEIDGSISSLSEHRSNMRIELAAAQKRGEFPRSRAILIDGVHMYGQLLDFETVIADHMGAETRETHTRMLQLLDTHYRVWDSIVEDGGGFTVDFHGPRLHTVFAEPTMTPQEQIRRTIALADRLANAAAEIGNAFGFPTRTRFGIDIGPSIALTTGRSHETDTLFLGHAPNHAAKITAEAPIEGIYLSESAQSYADTAVPFGDLRSAAVSETVTLAARNAHQFEGIDAAVQALLTRGHRPPEFNFRRQTPPLARMKFSALSPSRSVRMGIASLFADIDGYTAYVDDAIRRGGPSIRAAVTAIHVIREELNDVLKDDFDGKRVRFIGDCIHGILAEDEQQDDPTTSVENSLICASGMRSSFGLIQQTLSNLDSIDLAVGIEYGPIAVSRIGNTGDASIRCAAGRAVIESERVQQSITGGGVRLGQSAGQHANTPAVGSVVSASRIPEYDDMLNLVGSVAAPAIQVIRADPSARPHFAG